MCIVAAPTSWLLYIQRWPAHRDIIVVARQDPTSWLLYRGGLLIQWNLCNQLAAIQRWPAHRDI